MLPPLPGPQTLIRLSNLSLPLNTHKPHHLLSLRAAADRDASATNAASESNSGALVGLLRARGFTDAQAATINKKIPALFAAEGPDTTLECKLDFLLGLGFSPQAIAADPWLLRFRLARRLQPNFAALADVFGSAEAAALVARKFPKLLFVNLDKHLMPKVPLLRECGDLAIMPEKLTTSDFRRVLSVTPEKLAETVEMFKRMGLVPGTKVFVRAVGSFATVRASAVEAKLEVYRSVGWSDEEIMRAVRRMPKCLLVAQEKIRRRAEFYREELGWGPAEISVYPTLMGANLERTVAPRMAVWQVLVSKGLVEREMKPHDVKLAKKVFLERFVLKHGREHPEVLLPYQGENGVGAEGLSMVDG